MRSTFSAIAADAISASAVAPAATCLSLNICSPPYRKALERFSGIDSLPVSRTAASAELTDELQDLGYAAAGAEADDLPAPLDAGGRPSPKDIIGAINDTLLAQELSNQGEFERSEELLWNVVSQLPRNYFALDRLATALMRQGRFDEAIPHLRRVVADGPGWPGSWFNLGACLIETGQREQALDPLRRAVALKPTEELFRRVLLETLRASGREEEASTVERQLGG